MRTIRNASAARSGLVGIAATLLVFAGGASGAHASQDRQPRPQVLQDAVAALGGHSASGLDATLAMRDLALALPTLSAADQAQARSLLARPTDPGDPISYDGITPSSRCYTGFCLTWVGVGPNAPSMVDSNADGVPDWVDATRNTVDQVLTSFARAGYRPPLPDAGPPAEGPSTQLDVYLADLGQYGVYGYCVPDLDNYDRVMPGYCVLDNDFSTAEYGGVPLLTLGVTAAHELFHATQFAYDATESPWFMESTATWMEDELFDASDDNLQYLPFGPLGAPAVSLDDPDPNGLHVYGSWIFWRFLAEQLPRGSGPAIVRKSWELAGDGSGEPNLDGLRAVRSYVEAQGVDWASFFGYFAAANRFPADFYEEGANYPAAPVQAQVTLTPRRPSTGKRVQVVDHLASSTVLLKPVPAMRGKWSLKLAFDLPPRSDGVRAVVTVQNRGGGGKIVPVSLDAGGNGSLTTNFRPSDVAGVAVTLVNAGTRYQCDDGTDWNCAGTSLDDGRKLVFSATAKRT